MSEIFLFGDESGTMPIAKKDGPFVSAFVSYTWKNINDLEIDYHHASLLDSLKSNNIEPIINFVYPEDDYETKFRRRMEKMEVMARYSKLMTNNKHLLLNKGGIPIRNYIWIQGIGMTIGHSLLKMLTKENVRKISIYIDQKSMVESTRLFFENNISDIPDKIIGVLNKNVNRYPEYVKNVYSNFKFTKEDISIYWNDGDKYTEYKKGFLLAHHLARFSKNVLKKDGIKKLQETFLKSGFENSLNNYTKHLISPIERNTIENWKRSTGLPDPKI